MISREPWYKEADRQDRQLSELRQRFERGDTEAFREYLTLISRTGRMDLLPLEEEDFIPPGMEGAFKDFLKSAGFQQLAKTMGEWLHHNATDLSVGAGPVMWEAYTEMLEHMGQIPSHSEMAWWEVDLINWLHEQIQENQQSTPDDFFRVYWELGDELADQGLGWGNIPSWIVELTPERYLPSLTVRLFWEVYMPEGDLENPYGDEHAAEGWYGPGGLSDPQETGGPQEMNVKKIMEIVQGSHWEDLTGEGNLYGHYNAEIEDTNGWFDENYPGYAHVRAYLSFDAEPQQTDSFGRPVGPETLGQKVMEWVQGG